MYKTDKDLSNYSYEKISDISGKNVIMRSLLNVAVDSDGKVTDRTRLDEALPMIKEMSEKVKRLVIMAHLGRPEQREKKSSFWNVRELIQADLNTEVVLIEDLDDESIKMVQSYDNSKDGKKIFLIENIRFFKGEDSKDKQERSEFAKKLASLADVFINDAFADYRESASTYDIAKELPAFIGSAFLKEVSSLIKFSNPEKPFVAVLGGAKLSEKLDALRALVEVADKVIIGGAMAYTLMKAQGVEIGKSLFEEDKLDVAKEIMENFADKILLPKDHLVAEKFDKEAAYEYTEDEQIPADKIAIDIGWKSINEFKDALRTARSILWNGPMGVFEWEHSSIGTKEVGSTVPSIPGAFSLAGGGDSIAAINKFDLKGFSHISTGGGAMLAFLSYDEFGILDVILNK